MSTNNSLMPQALAGLLPKRYKVYAHKGMFNVLNIADNRFKLISDDQLKQIDKRLPAALHYLIKEHGSVHFSKVDELRELWGLDIHVKIPPDRMVAFSEIKSVLLVDHGIYVKGLGILYDNVYMADIDMYVPIPIARPIGVSVERDWLDEAHPDWERRFMIGQDLDMLPTDLMRNILAPAEAAIGMTLPTEFDPGS